MMGGLHYQVPVIGHEHERQQRNFQAGAAVFQELAEHCVFDTAAEQRSTVVATVKDVQDAVAGKNAMRTGHRWTSRPREPANCAPSAATNRWSRWHRSRANGARHAYGCWVSRAAVPLACATPTKMLLNRNLNVPCGCARNV